MLQGFCSAASSTSTTLPSPRWTSGLATSQMCGRKQVRLYAMLSRALDAQKSACPVSCVSRGHAIKVVWFGLMRRASGNMVS